jgi:hypothetical protein
MSYFGHRAITRAGEPLAGEATVPSRHNVDVCIRRLRHATIAVPARSGAFRGRTPPRCSMRTSSGQIPVVVDVDLSFKSTLQALWEQRPWGFGVVRGYAHQLRQGRGTRHNSSRTFGIRRDRRGAACRSTPEAIRTNIVLKWITLHPMRLYRSALMDARGAQVMRKTSRMGSIDGPGDCMPVEMLAVRLMMTPGTGEAQLWSASRNSPCLLPEKEAGSAPAIRMPLAHPAQRP